MNILFRIFCLLVLAKFACAQSAPGQFITDVRATPGCNGLVTSSTKLATGDVIFGGTFTRCGNVRANRVVRFDGTQFFSLGMADNNGVSGTVRTVFAEGTRVYVGGLFKSAGTVPANNIAVFENGQWRSIGRGLSNGVPGYVRAIQTYQNKLYVGGYSDPVNIGQAFLSEWNGTGWRPVVEFPGETSQYAVHALEVLNAKLYFAGGFRLEAGSQTIYNVGSFDGTVVAAASSSPISLNTSWNQVRDLHAFQGRLCAAGSFRLLGVTGQGGVACLQNGQWTGFSLYSARALGDDGVSLYSGGFASSAQGLVTAFRNGGPISFTSTQPAVENYVLTLVTQGNHMLFAGSFAQQMPAVQNIQRINVGKVEPIISGDVPQLNGPLSTMVAVGNEVYAADNHSNAFIAPNVPPLVAKRVNGAWVSLPSPIADSYFDGAVYVANNVLYFATYGSDEPFPLIINIIEWQDQLYASGGFTEADGQPVDGVARFDGTSWHAMGLGIQQSNDFDARAVVQLIPYQDKLYAYGNFDLADGRPANHVAQWDGSRWLSLDFGRRNGLGADIQSSVWQAVVANGALLFSGEIHEAGGEAADYFATWRGGEEIFRSSFE